MTNLQQVPETDSPDERPDGATNSGPRPPELMTCRVWHDGEVVEKDFPFEQLSAKLAKKDFLVWMDLEKPDRDVLNRLADELSLDPNAVEDAVSEHERPKYTRYADHVFITAYAARLPSDEADIELSQVSIFVVGNAVITVRDSQTFDMAPVIERWRDNQDLLHHGVGGLVHGLLDVIVDTHFDAVQALDDAIEALEGDLFADAPQTKQVQRNSFRLRKSLVALRRAVLPMREVVGAMLRHGGGNGTRDPLLDSYFQDLYDHVLRAAEWTESVRDMVTTVFETNLSLSDARMNVVMKKLTSWAAIIAVPTAVTGFYGQNVPYPGHDHWTGFVISSLIIVVSVLALYIGFRRRDWL